MASGNVLLLGAGKCIEGKYKKVRVIGSGQIEGDIACEKLTSAGAAQVTGNIYFERCKVSGAFEVKGNLEGKCLRIMGAGEVGGKIRVETCRAYGAIEVKDNINAEYFIVRGAIECIGSINCEKIMVELLGKCVVEEIGASEIAIGQKVKIKEKSIKHKMINKMRMHIGKEEGDLRAQAVEGDKIYLEKRPEEGLLAKLWGVPLITDAVWEKMKSELVTFEVLEQVQHVFTHRRWLMTPIVIEYTTQNAKIFEEILQGEGVFIVPEGLKNYAIATAFKKVLRKLQENI